MTVATEAFPGGVGLRPDAQLQRFGRGPQRADRRLAISRQKVEGLAASNLVQQGGELAYLIRHDPEFRGVRREHLVEAGRRVRLRSDIPALVEFLERGLDGLPVLVLRDLGRAARSRSSRRSRASCRRTTSSAPSSTTTRARARCGRSAACRRATARSRWSRSSRSGWASRPDRTIYVGDGSSDVHVMLHVNNRDGFTIAVSENKQLARIAKRTVLSDNAFSDRAPDARARRRLAVRRRSARSSSPTA